MKKTNSLMVEISPQQMPSSVGTDLMGLLPGIPMVIGLVGMTGQVFGLEVPELLTGMLAAVLSLTVSLLLRWQKRWQSIAAIAGLAVLLGGCWLMREGLSASLAGLLNRGADWFLKRTGTYVLPFTGDANIMPALLLAAGVWGVVTGAVVRGRSPVWQALCCLAVLGLHMDGLLESGWYLALYMAGTLLLLAKGASGIGSPLIFAGGLAAVIGAPLVGILLLCGFAQARSQAGDTLAAFFHRARYEEAENPLPEGDLSDLGAYSPSNAPALEVTMDQWSTLYLRGFVAGEYTDSGWEPLSGETAAEEAEFLYTLQRDHFTAATQLDAAWKAVGGGSSGNSVTVRNTGACTAYTFLPYGVGNISDGILNAANLTGEGFGNQDANGYTATVQSIQYSYLLQEQLANGEAEAEGYLEAEGAYREWVYAHYLALPEDTYETLRNYFSVDTTEVTTTQAKQEIVGLVTQALEYRENVLTPNGGKDFVSYLLSVSQQGYSVHYATLATLLLRSCGIPARYVEGYVAAPSQVQALENGDTLILTQKNSHAWTEYYLDGVGWLPFDATPGYTDYIAYDLPPNGAPADTGEANLQATQELEPPDREAQIQEEQTQEQQSRRIYIRAAAGALGMLIVLAVLVLTLRIAILRHRLRQREKRFYLEDHRAAVGSILCYLWELLALTGPQAGDIPMAAQAALAEEVWYSRHPITQAQREQALQWLNTAKMIWKETTPPLRRFRQRWLRCKVI